MEYYYFKGKQYKYMEAGEKCPTCQASSYEGGKKNRLEEYMSGQVWCRACGTVRLNHEIQEIRNKVTVAEKE